MTTVSDHDVSRETEELFGEGTPPIPGEKTGDPEAPYGFTAANVPRAKPGRKPGQRTGTGKSAAKAIPTPAKKTIPRQAPAQKKTQVDYRPALMSLTGEFIGAASIWGLMRDDMKMIANTATVWRAAPSIVEGINTAADKWPMVATVLDRFLPLAEFGKSGGAVLVMVAQLAVNQGMMPPGLIPGTMAPERLATTFIEEMMKTNPDFAEAVAAIQAARGQVQQPAE
jgi:hypothetical protein